MSETEEKVDDSEGLEGLEGTKHGVRPKNFDRDVPRRKICIPDRYWTKWDIAAKIAGLSRTHLIITVTNHAADVILDEHKMTDEVEQRIAEEVEKG